MVSGPLILRGGVVEDPFAVALEFVQKYVRDDEDDPSRPMSFDERDLRRANRGGARISAVEIAAILERREGIEHALGTIRPDASLAVASAAVPWRSLTRLFGAFAGIRGIGLSKMTKALHPKRPALIPMLDSVVQTYLADEPTTTASLSFAEQATALVRSYKRELDGNRSVLHELRRELAGRGFVLTDVRLLDVLIWSASAGA